MNSRDVSWKMRVSSINVSQFRLFEENGTYKWPSNLQPGSSTNLGFLLSDTNNPHSTIFSLLRGARKHCDFFNPGLTFSPLLTILKKTSLHLDKFPLWILFSFGWIFSLNSGHVWNPYVYLACSLRGIASGIWPK